MLYDGTMQDLVNRDILKCVVFGLDREVLTEGRIDEFEEQLVILQAMSGDLLVRNHKLKLNSLLKLKIAIDNDEATLDFTPGSAEAEGLLILLDFLETLSDEESHDSYEAIEAYEEKVFSDRLVITLIKNVRGEIVRFENITEEEEYEFYLNQNKGLLKKLITLLFGANSKFLSLQSTKFEKYIMGIKSKSSRFLHLNLRAQNRVLCSM